MVHGKVLLNRCTAIIISTLCVAIAILATSCGGGGSVNVAETRGLSAPGLSPSSLAFASQAVGATTSAQTITLTNSGNADLSVNSIAVSGANAGDFTQSNNCGSSVAAGASCAISVTFKPAASGTRTAAVTVSDNAAGGPQTVALSGSIATTLASVSPSSLALGDQPLSTASPLQAITLTNTGSADLNVTAVAVSGANASDFTQTNNCGSAVAAGSNCTISVTFKPVAAGTRTAAVIVADSSPTSPQTVPLSGTGDAPIASVSSSSVAFGNQSVGATSSAQAVSLTNTGNAPLNISSVAVFGTNAGDFAQTNNCGIALAAGANCTISVTFTPSAAGSRAAALAITDNAAGSPQSVSLSGTGISTVANLSPSSVAFGNQSVGATSSAQAVTLSNSGSSALSISSIAVFGTNSTDFAQTNNCGSSVAAGANCTISVTFTPSAAGSRGAALAVADNATGSPQSVSLSGTGISTGANVSPSSVAFGNQSIGATSTAQTVTLSNSGNSALSISSIAVFGTNAGDFGQTNNCGSSVAAGANCTINIKFTPSAAGSRAAALAITDNATGSPQSVSLSGTGTSIIASVSPTSLAFGNQSVGITSTTQSVTLTNSGNAALSITSVAVFGANASDFSQTGNCGSSVSAGASCTISVTFTPSASGSRAAALAITDNATGSPQSVSLSGTGTSIVASISPSSLAFGNQSVTTISTTQAVTLTNSGNAALSVTSIAVFGANAGDFAQTNNCASSVAAGANCTISVTFTPSASGSRAATIAITDNATGSPQTVSLSGIGTSTVAGVSPSSLSYGSRSVGTTSTAQAITLTNSGNQALSITSIAVSGTNAVDFAQSNNCGSSVAAGANCTISVTFTPTATGTRTATVTLTDDDASSPQAVALSGTGTAAIAGVSPSSLTFASQAVGATSAAQTITLANSGNVTLRITGIALSGTNAGDFAQTNNCGSSVAAGASCAISVTFKPIATGTRTAAVAITDNDTGSPQTVPLSGTIATTVASASPSSLTFASQAVGAASAAQAITLANTGNAALNVTAIAVSGANASDFALTNNCGSSVAAGANCTINATFKPTAAGARTATVTVADSATDSPQTVALSGTGAAAVASVSPTSLAFGNQSVGTTSAAQAITLTNSGNLDLTVTSMAISGNNASNFAQTNNCGSSVAAGASCTISVTFTPSATRRRSAILTITDSASGSPQSVSLSGTGVSVSVSVSPTSVAFGNQSLNTASVAHSITLTNSGNAALSVSSIAVSGTNASDFAQTNNCGSSVVAGANCTINVTFTPSASGSRAASVTITDGAASSPQSVSLSGTGTAPVATVSPTSLAFGNQSLTTASTVQSITLTNSGNAALSVSSIAISGANASDFAQTNNCGSSVAAGANCTINVSFKPAATGNRTAALMIADSATGSPQTVALSGTGTASAVSVSPSSLAFGSQSVGTASTAQTVTLTNSGNGALTVTSIGLSGVNAGDFAQANNCGSSVAAGASCAISVTFTPIASGSRAASLSIANSASPQTVSLGGTGASSADGVNLSPSSLAFSNQPVEMTSTAQTVTLTNNSTTALSISNLAVTGANSSDFVQNNNCGSSVAVGANCTIVVLFTPSAIGARTAVLSVSDNATGSPQTVSMSGTGIHDVVLSWTASPTQGVIGYYIYRGTTSGGESSTPLNSTPTNGTSFTDETVTARATYYYLVTSVASDGVTQSAASTETAATVPSP
jgi:hypothetical protein